MTLAMILSGFTGPLTSWKGSLKLVTRDGVVVGAGLDAGGAGGGAGLEGGTACTAGVLSSLSHPRRTHPPRRRMALMNRVRFTVFILSDVLIGGIGPAQGIAFLWSGVGSNMPGGGVVKPGGLGGFYERDRGGSILRAHRQRGDFAEVGAKGMA